MTIPSKLDLVLWGLLAAGAIGLLMVVASWRDDSVNKLPAAQREIDRLEFDYDALSKRVAANDAKTENHGNEFEQAESRLDDARADTPARDVRLCVDSVPSATRPSAREASRGDHAASADAGQLPEAPRRDIEERAAAGPDIGPELYALIDEADHTALVATSCQAWERDNP